MVKEFIITYWELIVIGFLLLNTGIQKLEKIKGDSDILTWIWQFLSWIKSVARQVISVIFSTKPGKLPMLLLGLFLLIPSTACVAGMTDLTLEWDTNTDPAVVQVRIYQRDYPDGAYDYNNPTTIVPIPATETTLTNILNGTYAWVARAVDSEGRESVDSNEVSDTFSVPPKAMKNLRKKLVIPSP